MLKGEQISQNRNDMSKEVSNCCLASIWNDFYSTQYKDLWRV